MGSTSVVLQAGERGVSRLWRVGWGAEAARAQCARAYRGCEQTLAHALYTPLVVQHLPCSLVAALARLPGGLLPGQITEGVARLAQTYRAQTPAQCQSLEHGHSPGHALGCI